MKNYTLLSCVESKIIHPTKFYGRFELGQFATGQGLTVANALRRALLSQLPGVSMTLVQIENVSQEYENIPGVQECALDIILNLKNIILTTEFEVFSPQVGFLNVKGPGVVRAGDLKLPFFVSCVNPDQYIATLSEKGQLNMTVLINSGKNYLNHTPSSPGYETRVKLLKRAKKKVRTMNSISYYTWKDQRQQSIPSKYCNVMNLIQAKLAQQLSVRQNENQPVSFGSKGTLPLGDLNTRLERLKNKIRLKKYNKRFQTQKTVLSNSTQINDAIKPNGGEIKKQANSTVQQKTREGYLPINAIFSPVIKANYTIQMKNDDQKGEIICFEVWTNGSIDPRRAIHRSVKSVIKLFLPFQRTHTGLPQTQIGEKTVSLKNSPLQTKRTPIKNEDKAVQMKQKRWVAQQNQNKFIKNYLIHLINQLKKNEHQPQTDFTFMKNNVLRQRALFVNSGISTKNSTKTLKK